MRDEKHMNLDRKPRSMQWYGGILSYATTILLVGFQTEKVERITPEKNMESRE